MNEAEWLACSDPVPMLKLLDRHDLLDDRRQRLFDCACVRRAWHLLLDQRGRNAVKIAEKYADGFTRLGDLREAQADAFAAAQQLPGAPNLYTVLAAAAGAAWEFRSGADPVKQAAAAIAWEGLTEKGPPTRRIAKVKLAEERAVQAALLRDIFGNPFHQMILDPTWLTPEVIDLARLIYDKQSFDQMPQLADTLEAAGCTNEEIVAHCRSPGLHVRGCFVVDLVSGKEGYQERLDGLIAKIEAAFAEVKHPNGRDWRDEPHLAIENSPFVVHASPKAFPYYLPAYMIWVLRNYRTTGSLTVKGTLDSLDAGAGRVRQSKVSRFSVLTTPQRIAVVAFLEFMRKHSDRFAYSLRALKALDSWWRTNT